MILHFSQIGFTDDLTFTVILLSIDQQSCSSIIPKNRDECKHFFVYDSSFSGAAGIMLSCAAGNPRLRLWAALQKRSLFIHPDNPALGQIVWGQLNGNFVAWQDTDIVHTKLSADMCQYLVAVFQLDLEHGVW